MNERPRWPGAHGLDLGGWQDRRKVIFWTSFRRKRNGIGQQHGRRRLSKSATISLRWHVFRKRWPQTKNAHVVGSCDTGAKDLAPSTPSRWLSATCASEPDAGGRRLVAP